MKQLLTLTLILSSFFCFGQKLDSIKVNAFEAAQLKNYLQGDKAKEIAQLQERVIFLQRELQLLNEAKETAIRTPLARENKQGQPTDFRNGYLIFKP
jgi:cell division protein FtsB